MLPRIAADLVVVFHAAYVLFVIGALVLVCIGARRRWEWVRNRWFRGIHLLMILVVIVEAWLGIVCPLTTLENKLRRAGGEQPYPGDFIARWVHELLFFELPSWVFTVCYTAFGLAVLASLWLVPVRWRKNASRNTGY